MFPLQDPTIKPLLPEEPVELSQLLRAEHSLDLQPWGRGPAPGPRGQLPHGQQVQPDRRRLRGAVSGQGAQKDGEGTVQLNFCMFVIMWPEGK